VSSVLEQVQRDIADRLLSLDYFVDVPVFVLREQRIDSMIEQALSGITKKNGKSGVAVFVLMPLVNCSKQDAPGPLLDGECLIRTQELPLINFGASGTQKSAEDVTLVIIGGLHHFALQGVCGPIVAGKDTLTPSREYLPKITYDTKVQFKVPTGSRAKTEAPKIVRQTSTTIRITCNMPGAEIYYTTDGTFPRSGNGTLFAGDFVIAAPVTVRAAAYVDGLDGSNVMQLTISS
jgi:hypothetical protein